MTHHDPNVNQTTNDIDLSAPELYINRELSWLNFNERVLEEAMDINLPLLERVRFLAIFSTNLDEFFMIRVAGLKKQIAAGVIETTIDGMTPLEQLEAIRELVLNLKEKQAQCWINEVMPALEVNAISIVHHSQLDTNQKRVMRTFFRHEILPVLTPLAVDPGRPFPHISNLSLNLAISLIDEQGHSRFARLKIPTTDTLPRFISVNNVMTQYSTSQDASLVLVYLEEIIEANLDLLFPGMAIQQAYPFRVVRDADVEIADDEASDLLATIEQGVQQRYFGGVVQLIVARTMPLHIRQMLMHNLAITPRDIYEIQDPLGLNDLYEIVGLELPHLKYAKFTPSRSPFLPENILFDSIRKQDVLVFHPYESFDSTVDFIQLAARDPHVLAIKISLYRVGNNSPIVEALLDAREAGKQVAALVELKARFDEENNITWAKALEAQGVHVVYGLIGLKTHAKIALVVRREHNIIRRYVHLSTGNYNANTSRVYSDIGFFSCREDLAEDVTLLFNRITGFAPEATYQKLLVAPEQLRGRLLAMIDREIEYALQGRPARLILKANSLTDPECIQKIYQASQAGVQIDLIIRGICRLRPDILGVSETIRVRSIVGRFLEHSRIYWFENGGQPEVYLGSADLMERNLDRRVEQVFPIEETNLKAFLYNVLMLQLRDNVGTRILRADGSWEWSIASENDELVDSQAILLSNRDNLLEMPIFE